MSRRTIEPAFAKLNLSLDVLGARPDGYHDMRMVMQSVDLCDEVDMTLTDLPGIEVETSRDDLPSGEKNLAGKAARAFLDYAGLSDRLGVKVYIKKNIPDRAGMAGGSSDAAAVLRGLDRLLDAGLSDGELYDLCLKVGSDVPFCLYGGTALAQGRGEVLTDLPPLPRCGILIVKPEFSVSTPELFDRVDKLGFVNSTYTETLLKALLERVPRTGPEGLINAVGNVFTTALPPAERGVIEGVEKALLDSGALSVTMTGTGSAVFGIFPTLRDAGAVTLPKAWQSFAVSPTKKLSRGV